MSAITPVMIVITPVMIVITPVMIVVTVTPARPRVPACQQSESGPLRAVHFSRHKWLEGLVK